jgi:hypothetical protein
MPAMFLDLFKALGAVSIDAGQTHADHMRTHDLCSAGEEAVTRRTSNFDFGTMVPPEAVFGPNNQMRAK